MSISPRFTAIKLEVEPNAAARGLVCRVRTILRPGEEDDSASSSGDEQPEAAPASAAAEAALRQVPADEEREAGSWRTWEVLWKAGGGEGHLQRLTFQGPHATRAFLQHHMSQASEAWSLSMACTDGMQGTVPGAHLAPLHCSKNWPVRMRSSPTLLQVEAIIHLCWHKALG